jgi:hypothetical protein
VVSVAFGRGFFRVEGHAGKAPHGEDTLCAAVSALAQALLYGLIEVARVPVDVRRLESGRIDARWLEASLTPEARAILATVEGSLREIAARNAVHLRVERLADDSALLDPGVIV